MEDYSHVPVDELGYREVQKELSRLGLPAKGKKDELTERLREYRSGSGQGATGTASKSPKASAKTPRTARKSRAAEVVDVEENVQVEIQLEEPQAAQANLQQAHSVPLPESPELPSPRRKSAGKAKQPTPNRQQASPKRTPSKRRRGEQAAAHPVPWKWALATLGAALLLGLLWNSGAELSHLASVPRQGLQQMGARVNDSWQHSYSWVAQHSKQALRAPAEAWQRATHAVQQAVSNGKAHLGQGGGSKLVGPPCASSLSPDVLDVIMPPGSAWAGVRAQLRDVWRGHKEQRNKAVGVLLAGKSREACTAAALAVQQAAPPECSHCVLQLHVRDSGLARGGAEVAGSTQAALAAHLRNCSAGVVVVDGMQHLHPDVLPVFINALSEGGHFEVDGTAVPTHHSLFIFTMRVKPTTFEIEQEDDFNKSVKAQLVARLGSNAPKDDAVVADPETQAPEHASVMYAQALRRRLDYVAPLRT